MPDQFPPSQTPDLPRVTRRQFIRLLGGALPLALGACGGADGPGSVQLPLIAPDGWKIEGEDSAGAGVDYSAGAGKVERLASADLPPGFTLLTTLDGYTNWDASPHAGSVWDAPRRRMWWFGAETHNNVYGKSGMGNAVYYFDLADGLVRRVYAPSDWPGEYRIDADGITWADAAHTRPFAMHTFMRLDYDPATQEIAVACDSLFHYNMARNYVSIQQEGAIAPEDRMSPIWYYHTGTGQWRHELREGTSAFCRDDAAHPAIRLPGIGWVCLGGTYLHRLDEAGVHSRSNHVYGHVNAQFQGRLIQIGNQLIKFGGDNGSEAETSTLYSIHTIDATNLEEPIAAGIVHPKAEYPALDGISIQNLPAVAMPDGRILFMGLSIDPQVTAGKYRAFILDPTSNTVAHTGHEIAEITTKTLYDFNLHWVDDLGCAILLTHRFRAFGKDRIYACKPA